MKTIYLLLLLICACIISCSIKKNEANKPSHYLEKPIFNYSPDVKLFKAENYDANIILSYAIGEGVLIDAGGCSKEIIDFVQSSGIEIKYIILTHSHHDHIEDLTRLKDNLKSKIVIQKFDLNSLKNQVNIIPDIVTENDTIINCGGIEYKILNTPGHTPGGISIYFSGRLASGDALFFESIGRTDFPGGDKKTLLNSIKNKLFKLPDSTVVIPGHGETTTIQHEKRNNFFLY